MLFKTHFKQNLSLVIGIVGYFRGPQSDPRQQSLQTYEKALKDLKAFFSGTSRPSAKVTGVPLCCQQQTKLEPFFFCFLCSESLHWPCSAIKRRLTLIYQTQWNVAVTLLEPHIFRKPLMATCPAGTMIVQCSLHAYENLLDLASVWCSFCLQSFNIL